MIRTLKLITLTLLTLAGMVAGVGAAAAGPAAAQDTTARGGPSDVWEITIWEDDPAKGARLCRQAERDYAPARCHVEPESAAPDPNRDGWANTAATEPEPAANPGQGEECGEGHGGRPYVVTLGTNAAFICFPDGYELGQDTEQGE